MKKIFIIFFLTACDPTLPITDPTAPPDPLPAEDSNWCKPGCDHLATLPGQDNKLGCYESRPLELPEKRGKSISCAQFCEETQKNGRLLNPQCWTTISNCEEIESICNK